MSRGDNSKYTPKQGRTARHIEASYESHGLYTAAAAARAWATVNKQSAGGERSGSARQTCATKRSRRASTRRAAR
jgi:hypothetical protein